jgi:hypothetical protein
MGDANAKNSDANHRRIGKLEVGVGVNVSHARAILFPPILPARWLVDRNHQ